MIVRKMMLGVLVVLMTASCAAPQPTQPQPSPAVAAALPTATRARAARPTPTPQPTATATVLPTDMPSATPTTAPTATPSPSPTSTPGTSQGSTAVPASVGVQQPAPAQPIAAGGLLLPINPNKYPAPVLVSPPDNTTYHVSQPVAHLVWSGTADNFMTFGQTPSCVSDATNFRRAYESYQLVIHSLDGARPDQVQWNQNNPGFDLNLTTVPAGRYSWSVNIVTLCESYVVGQRNDTLPLGKTRYDDPSYHRGTLQTTLVGAISRMSATRVINWIP